MSIGVWVSPVVSEGFVCVVVAVDPRIYVVSEFVDEVVPSVVRGMEVVLYYVVCSWMSSDVGERVFVEWTSVSAFVFDVDSVCVWTVA